MRPIEAIVAELEQESAATLRVLDSVPEAKLTWRPHPKSMSLGQLALHVASIPENIPGLIDVDLTTPPPGSAPEAKSRKEIMDAYARGMSSARETLTSWNDDKVMGLWAFKPGGKTLMEMPRIAALRVLLLNHLYHHRGQMQVYLRLLDVPVPSVYGPTADTNPFA